ncbi:hypothetical protein CH063_07547 [Colletotrichum higginsianum]|uniref:Uncharacterized protein n=1 Tax=Colletotrichum higginsianum (strain IMI 349063) TaxID=759273 RepID=H1V6J5_COLHI|nr:hypothetical protein CH063_07547 [Colletotrichum higginsianum]
MGIFYAQVFAPRLSVVKLNSGAGGGEGLRARHLQSHLTRARGNRRLRSGDHESKRTNVEILGTRESCRNSCSLWVEHTPVPRARHLYRFKGIEVLFRALKPVRHSTLSHIKTTAAANCEELLA